jgi:hypothetical protein
MIEGRKFLISRKKQSHPYNFTSAFLLSAFASSAGRLRNRSAAVFASFKKYAAHFLNPQQRWGPNQKRRLTRLLERVGV